MSDRNRQNDDNLLESAEVAEALQLINDRIRSTARLEPCSLAAYREIVADLPRPTDKQVDNFVAFVAEAHSWYKHLRPLPPGTPFLFFLDPYAGCDRIPDSGGRVSYQERTEDSFQFHYTWMTTAAYRSSFGYLAYEAEAGTSFFVGSGDRMREYSELPVVSTPAAEYRIPSEVAEAGSVEVTAIVHPEIAQVSDWIDIQWRLEKGLDKGPVNWPDATGGSKTLEAIWDVVRRSALAKPEEHDQVEVGREFEPELAAAASLPEAERGQREHDIFARMSRAYSSTRSFDRELETLLRPERERLRGEMGKAIRRMLDLVKG